MLHTVAEYTKVDKFQNIFRIAKITLIFPAKSTWPERGTTAVKQIKTRITNYITLDLLISFLLISKNDLSLENKAQVRQSGSMSVFIITKKETKKLICSMKEILRCKILLT